MCMPFVEALRENENRLKIWYLILRTRKEKPLSHSTFDATQTMFLTSFFLFFFFFRRVVGYYHWSRIPSQLRNAWRTKSSAKHPDPDRLFIDLSFHAIYLATLRAYRLFVSTFLEQNQATVWVQTWHSISVNSQLYQIGILCQIISAKFATQRILRVTFRLFTAFCILVLYCFLSPPPTSLAALRVQFVTQRLSWRLLTWLHSMPAIMAAGNQLFLMRLVSSSVAVANRAGGIIRSIMKTGSLNVVDKVCSSNSRYCRCLGIESRVMNSRSLDLTNM